MLLRFFILAKYVNACFYNEPNLVENFFGKTFLSNLSKSVFWQPFWIVFFFNHDCLRCLNAQCSFKGFICHAKYSFYTNRRVKNTLKLSVNNNCYREIKNTQESGMSIVSSSSSSFFWHRNQLIFRMCYMSECDMTHTSVHVRVRLLTTWLLEAQMR